MFPLPTVCALGLGTKRFKNPKLGTVRIYSNFLHVIVPFNIISLKTKFKKQSRISTSEPVSHCSNHKMMKIESDSCFAQEKQSADKVGILTLRRTISESSRFLHCAKHILSPMD